MYWEETCAVLVVVHVTNTCHVESPTWGGWTYFTTITYKIGLSLEEPELMRWVVKFDLQFFFVSLIALFMPSLSLVCPSATVLTFGKEEERGGLGKRSPSAFVTGLVPSSVLPTFHRQEKHVPSC
jgi:hypothetical protein